MTDRDEEFKPFDELWKEINDRFERIEENNTRFKELVDTIERQLKEHKEKFPGS